jgi:DNA-binding transcriptional MerR regulator
MPDSGTLRIGQFSRVVGVPASVLRAWERRYGVPDPRRSPSGYRLYGNEDERRVRRMVEHIARGVAPSDSARLVRGSFDGEGDGDALAALTRAWEALDVTAAHRALDVLLAGPEPEAVALEVILPLLEDRTAEDPEQAEVAHRVLEARLLSRAADWHEGSGPLAVLACVPGDARPSALIALGLALHREGWRIAYLGAGAPTETVDKVAAALGAERVVHGP